MNKKQLTYWLKVAVIGIALGLGLQFVRAWTEPTAAPPGGNVGAPINTSGNAQTKAGGLTAGTLTAATVTGTTQFCLGTSCITSWPSGGSGGGTSCPACSVFYYGNNNCMLTPQGFSAYTFEYSCHEYACGGEIYDQWNLITYRCVWGNWTAI